jgi:hypothetical protein
MTRSVPGLASVGPVQADSGELVFSCEVPTDASIFECLRLAWEDARSDALALYDEWSATRERSAYFVYRASQDRADAAQDALAQVARSL